MRHVNWHNVSTPKTDNPTFTKAVLIKKKKKCSKKIIFGWAIWNYWCLSISNRKKEKRQFQFKWFNQSRRTQYSFCFLFYTFLNRNSNISIVNSTIRKKLVRQKLLQTFSRCFLGLRASHAFYTQALRGRGKSCGAGGTLKLLSPGHLWAISGCKLARSALVSLGPGQKPARETSRNPGTIGRYRLPSGPSKPGPLTALSHGEEEASRGRTQNLPEFLNNPPHLSTLWPRARINVFWISLHFVDIGLHHYFNIWMSYSLFN